MTDGPRARVWSAPAELQRLRADAQTIIDRYPVARSALLPLLHLVQSEDGYVSPDGIEFCARLLDLSPAEVAAVTTFYTQFKRHPNGEFTVGVCTNALCAVLGGDAIFGALREHLGIGHDETTPDGAVTLERVECNAACDYAPVVMVNWEFFDNQTPSSARQIVDELREGRPVTPTRGAARVCTFKQVSRVLAGFPDGRADEGVGAGPASLRGTLLARERGWLSPDEDAGPPPRAGHDRARRPAAADAGARREPVRRQTSAHDAPAVPADTAERAGTTAGKPGADAEPSAQRPAGGADAPATGKDQP